MKTLKYEQVYRDFHEARASVGEFLERVYNQKRLPSALGFNAFAPEWPALGAADAAPAVSAPESMLGSHFCVALCSAQAHPEWTTSTSPCNTLSVNGDHPLNFVSHSRHSLPYSDPKMELAVDCRRRMNSNYSEKQV
jgi:hypothetical protein